MQNLNPDLPNPLHPVVCFCFSHKSSASHQIRSRCLQLVSMVTPTQDNLAFPPLHSDPSAGLWSPGSQHVLPLILPFLLSQLVQQFP